MSNDEKYLGYVIIGFVIFFLAIVILQYLFTPQIILLGDLEISISPIMIIGGAAGILGLVYLVIRFDIKI